MYYKLQIDRQTHELTNEQTTFFIMQTVDHPAKKLSRAKKDLFTGTRLLFDRNIHAMSTEQNLFQVYQNA